MQIDDVGSGVLLHHPVTDGVHEVGLAEPDATVDEQGVVVRIVRIGGHVHRSGSGHLVGLAFDEVLEGELSTQPRLHEPPAVVVRLGCRRCDRLTIESGGWTSTPNLYDDVQCRGINSLNYFLDVVEEVVGDPISHIRVRGQEAQPSAVLHRMQRPNPCVELLRRQIGFQTRKAAFPDR